MQRTLEKAGSTPQAFIKGVRLDKARELLTAPTTAMTICEVAAAVCIPHLGRFSDDDRERFGEQPSATLARARRTAGLPR